MAPSPNLAVSTLPHYRTFPIGARHDDNVFTPLVGILKRMGDTEGHAGSAFALNSPGTLPSALMCCVRNYGDTSFTLAVTQSANNNLASVPGQPSSADAYAAHAIRIPVLASPAVAGGTVTVVPGGMAVFIVEWASTDDDYLKFEVGATENGAFGELCITHFGGALSPRERESVP